MSQRYWLRYWEPAMNTESQLEKLDFDPGCAGHGGNRLGAAVDWKQDSFLFMAYGHDLWYASKVVGIVRLDGNKGIGAILIYRALQFLYDSGRPGLSIETVATQEGAKLLTGMFGFRQYDDACVKKWEGNWTHGMNPAIEKFLQKSVLDLTAA
jgi:hypothetical protein